MTNIAVTGTTGRMGRAVVESILSEEQAHLSGALVRPGSALAGEDAGRLIGHDQLGVKLTDNLSACVNQAEVVIDFSLPELLMRLGHLAADKNVALVSGTTGLNSGQEAELTSLAKRIPILWAPNMSLGVNLLMALVEKTASLLDERFDIEIVEMHHRYKKDAPSGTAWGLARSAASGRGVDIGSAAALERAGERKAGDIGLAVLRGGSVVGDHRVMFAGEGEVIELAHKAQDRSIFARGAVAAALWLHDQPPGLYSMRDMLGV